jgi:uncharacterized protein (TIGR02271 family)
MSRTITAMFDSRSEADAARQRLEQSSIDANRIRIIDQSGSGAISGGADATTAGSSSGQGGFWDTLKDMFMPDEDRHAYGEGIHRGHFMLAAEVDEHQADQACQILEGSSSVDFDRRTDEWREQGWGGRYEHGMGGTDAQSGAFGPIGSDNDHDATDRSRPGMTGGATTGSAIGGDRDRIVEEERIPIVEEQLRVGKREVSRGGARVRSYVREIPVHEDVTLHQEHVSVERRPVNEALGRDALQGGDVFRDREIEMTERSEEAVVGKEAVVREELVLRKRAEDRVEGVDDTVRRTEVDVDEGTTDGERSALFGKDRDRDGVRDPHETRDPSLTDRNR